MGFWSKMYDWMDLCDKGSQFTVKIYFSFHFFFSGINYLTVGIRRDLWSGRLITNQMVKSSIVWKKANSNFFMELI